MSMSYANAPHLFRQLIPLVLTLAAGGACAYACTSAIFSRAVTADGTMMLWKHRDSGFKDNVVERVEGKEGALTYVAVFNAADRDLKEAWIGVNEAGFAVMNTASYNLAPDTAAVKDREGVVMTMALRRCHRAADFTALLDSLIATGRPLGVQANFGVIDKEGGGMYVEASDWSYTVFPLEEEKEGWMMRTNYSYSGGREGRLGVMRHTAARQLISDAISEGTLRASTLTETLSRSFYHAGSKRDLLHEGVRQTEDAGDLIVRRSSCSSTVIILPPGGAPEMLVAIGNPLLSEARRVTLDSIPPELRPIGPAGHSPLCDRVNALRDRVWHSKNRRGKWVIDLEAYRRILRELEERGSRRGPDAVSGVCD